ncbi:MAG: hypothetical protein LQ346_007599 [Caloplaca aetnensis]|nr:MAG: hypothetical protein LQ346_007599 [Caloplaca aetnensis]
MYSAQSLSLVPIAFFALLALSTALSPQANCSTCLHNPIATDYPSNITGTINATSSIVLVSLPYARSLLPSRFANSILTQAYTRFNIHPSAYPLVLETATDHDIRFNNINAVRDFSSIRFTFPFLDLLGDGYSCFRYNGYIYLPPDNNLIIDGTEAYGQTVLPAFFDPPDAPYKSTKNNKLISFAVYANSSTSSSRHHRPSSNRPIAAALFRDTPSISPVPFSFFKNITNQPLFGNNTNVCDNQIAFWNTTTSTGAYAPQGIVGEATLGPPLVPRRTTFRGIRGIRAERTFLENNYLPCASLKGYAGTGEGDSG